MAKRDPIKTARNKKIASYTEQLQVLLPGVFSTTAFKDLMSLNATIGSKNGEFIDLLHAVIYSEEEFVSLWLKGLKVELSKPDCEFKYKLLDAGIKTNQIFRDYVFIFLKRSFLNHYEELTRNRPNIDDSFYWFGVNDQDYGLFITPRYVNGQWENDKSEIRHFTSQYWTIGHVMDTGLIVPNTPDIMMFSTIEQLMVFYTSVLARSTRSPYQLQLANMYASYVLSHPDPRSVSFMIPELRYNGMAREHKYRLDFTFIDPYNFNKVGIELSPWSTHGYLSGLKGKTQQEINDLALDNFQREMKKIKDYFKKFGIFTLIFTDVDLKDMGQIFSYIYPYLEPKNIARQLDFHILYEYSFE